MAGWQLNLPPSISVDQTTACARNYAGIEVSISGYFPLPPLNNRVAGRLQRRRRCSQSVSAEMPIHSSSAAQSPKQAHRRRPSQPERRAAPLLGKDFQIQQQSGDKAVGMASYVAQIRG